MTKPSPTHLGRFMLKYSLPFTFDRACEQFRWLLTSDTYKWEWGVTLGEHVENLGVILVESQMLG